MAYFILSDVIVNNADNFNKLVSNALNSKKCCCDDVSLKKLFAIFSFDYELQRYYRYDKLEELSFLNQDSYYYSRKIELEAYISDMLASVCVNEATTPTKTTNKISYEDLPYALRKISVKEYKNEKSGCWCELLKTQLSYHIRENSTLYGILNPENQVLVGIIVPQINGDNTPTLSFNIITEEEGFDIITEDNFNIIQE